MASAAGAGDSVDQELIQLVARNVRATRRAKKLSQAAVASRLGMSTTNYSRIEAGRQNLTLSTLARLAAALAVRPVDLMRPPKRRAPERV
ncbi:MAG: helix-turn-helix transcriptional regulator [Polyangiaceae bacterium]|nr:helix-turn-helix transcriptional regulator [Polyangiaceae bacterium]